MQMSDLVRFLALPAIVASAGLSAALVSFRIMRGRIDAEDAKFLDGLAGGVLAFSFFLLAFTVADGRERISAARAVVTEEASAMHVLRRQAGPEGRLALESYARSVVDDEWASMALGPPGPSPRSAAALDALRAACDSEDMPLVETGLARLETLRVQRLQLANSRSPTAFWVAIGFLLLCGCVLYGAALSSRTRRLALALYLSGLGVVIALVLELEKPFAGVVHVSPAVISDSISGWSEQK